MCKKISTNLDRKKGAKSICKRNVKPLKDRNHILKGNYKIVRGN